MENILDGYQRTVERRPAGWLWIAPFQAGCLGAQPFPATRFREQRLNIRVHRIDAVAHLVHIVSQIATARAKQ